MIVFVLVCSVILLAVAEHLSRRDDLRELRAEFGIDSTLTEPDEQVALRFTVQNAGRWPVLYAALTLQLAVTPGVVQSPAFQLSYLAMLGIITLFPRLQAWYPSGARFDPFRRIWTGVTLALSCQLFTAPLVWLRFHTFPKYFLLTNLAALPLTEGFLLCALAALCGIFPAGTKKLADLLGQSLLSLLGAIAATP